MQENVRHRQFGGFLLQETGKRVAITRDCYSQFVTHFLCSWKPGDQNLVKDYFVTVCNQGTRHSIAQASPRPARSSAQSSIKGALPAAGKPCARAARSQELARGSSEAAAGGCCGG